MEKRTRIYTHERALWRAVAVWHTAARTSSSPHLELQLWGQGDVVQGVLLHDLNATLELLVEVVILWWAAAGSSHHARERIDADMASVARVLECRVTADITYPPHPALAGR